jgi:membrane protein
MADETHMDAADSTVPRRPREFTASDWKSSFAHVRESIQRDHLSIVAPGVAFYLLFGLIPALVALISIYGLVFNPADVQQHFAQLQGALPEEVHELLVTQMDRIAEEQTAAGLGAIIGIVLALWAGSRAVLALMEGLNITYGAEENRGIIKRAGIRLGLTLAAVLLGIIALMTIAVLPAVFAALPFPDAVITLLSLARWPVLLLIGAFGIALLYRYAPNRPQPPLRWLTWGAVTAAVLWVVASILFSVYVANFGSYNETYGTLGALVIMLMWLLITAYVILLGAEVDEALERQMRQRHA